MRKWHRVLSILLACMLILSTTVLAADVLAKGTCGLDVRWQVDTEGKLAIFGEGKMYDFDSDPGAWVSEGYPITSIEIGAGVQYIGASAFANMKDVTEITFLGNAPSFSEYNDCFAGIDAVCYYPAGDSTWTAENMLSYGGNLTWTPAGGMITGTTEGYTAGLNTLSSDTTVGDTVLVYVNASHSADGYYAAGQVSVSYDEGKLSLNLSKSSVGAAGVESAAGTVKLVDYGPDKVLGNGIYTLAFDAISSGAANITLSSAAFVKKENALEEDLIPATIENGAVQITVHKKTFAVTLPESGIFTGPATAVDGETYTFSAADSGNYIYSDITATVNGTPVSVKDNGDGTYSIASVWGPVVITGTRTEKQYSVTFDGNGAGEVTGADKQAVYGTDYSFTLPTVKHWNYSVDKITIGGASYSGYSASGSVITIPGTGITGDIVITVKKVQTEASVTVTGEAAGAAAGYPAEVRIGAAYTLNINGEAGYRYIVTAIMGDEPVKLVQNGNQYTISAVTGDIVFTVERVVVTDQVTANIYYNLDGTKIWLVRHVTTLGTGKVPTYNGVPMYYSEAYSAYCYLVQTPTLSSVDAAKEIGITDGNAERVLYDHDVNGTGTVDASDAQVIYNMYNAVYPEFTQKFTVERALSADVNGDGIVDVKDPTAIVNTLIHKS